MDNSHKKEMLGHIVSADVEESTITNIGHSTSTTLADHGNNTEDMTTWLLEFLGNASNETLATIVVGLVALTWTILGRLGLILIGALGGIVLHATWEGQQSGSLEAAHQLRKESGIQIIGRILDSRTKHSLDQEKEAILDRLSSASPGEGFEDFRPETANALVEFVEAVIRDYVKWWYGPIVPTDGSFPAACRKTLTNYIRAISTQLSRKRPADTFIDFLTNSTSIIVVFLGELQNAVNAPIAKSMTTTNAVDEYLVANPESSLASIMNTKQQQKKFKMIAEDILENYLDKTVLACDPSRVFLREILAGVVLEMSLNTCSKPEWLNSWIVYLLESEELAINNATDEGMTTVPIDSIDGDVGNVSIAKQEKSNNEKKHQNRMIGAEKAMEEAMDEAKRLSLLIAEEDRKKLRIKEDNVGEVLAQLTAKDSGANITVHDDNGVEGAESLSVERVENLKHEIVKPEPNRSVLGALPTVDEGKPLADTAGSDDSGGQATPTTDTRSGRSSPRTPHNTEGKLVTRFDQTIESPTSPLENAQVLPSAISMLTLHNAMITVHDDSAPNDRGKIRTKPVSDYWVQIEPESSQFQGWMIFRRYADFETLHEVLRRIATISGVASFLEQHRDLPDWRAHTKPSLRGELERYLRDACWYQPLAESEGMKRFLEKDQAQAKESGKGVGGLGWPTPAAFESMGKGMLDALTAGPKSAAEGTKAAFGGVTSVFGTIGTGLGNLGPKKRDSLPAARPVSLTDSGRSSSSQNLKSQSPARTSTISISRVDSSPILPFRQGRTSEESTRSTRSSRIPLDRRSSYISISEDGTEKIIPLSGTRESTRSEKSSPIHSRDNSRPPSSSGLVRTISPRSVLENMVLPPPPSDIPDDYAIPSITAKRPQSSSSIVSKGVDRRSISTASSIISPSNTYVSSQQPQPITQHTKHNTSSPISFSTESTVTNKEFVPISESETRVCVELIFATINELYTLSSAWSLRRALLTTAKTYLVRPGNPSLLSIQTLLQESILQPMTADSAIAGQLLKLRANTMPTEAELALWPKDLSTQDKYDLRIKARDLLVKRGVPAALVGVMGQAATGEAVGRVFDSLQEGRVLRGVMFGLLLQGVRALTQ